MLSPEPTALAAQDYRHRSRLSCAAMSFARAMRAFTRLSRKPTRSCVEVRPPSATVGRAIVTMRADRVARPPAAVLAAVPFDAEVRLRSVAVGRAIVSRCADRVARPPAAVLRLVPFDAASSSARPHCLSSADNVRSISVARR